MIKLLILRILLLKVLLLNAQKSSRLNTNRSIKLEGDGTYGLCENESGKLYYFKESDDQRSECERTVAMVKYSNLINETGWAFVEVEVSPRVPEAYKQGYAAGFVEGRATRELIRLHLSNTVDGFCDGAKQFCEDFNDYLMQNYLWMQQNIASYPSNRYWIQVNMTLNQLLGMIDGYEGTLGRSWAVEELVAHPLYLIQLAGDIEDLAAKFGRPETPSSLLTGTGHCSALIKLLPDFSDIYFSHVTWASYSSMLRMQKRYTFATNDPGHSYSFSGYPGSISSVDDFVLTASRLAILETTISNYNERLYKYMTPASVLCWVRAQVAHRTSSSGLQWAKVFSRFNSGTYNNQWNVLDYKMFKRNRRDHPSHGLLHVLEQLPCGFSGLFKKNILSALFSTFSETNSKISFRNHTAHADMTHALFRNTYWPSYNSPYFPKIFEWSDTEKMVKKFGDWYTYDKTPRALIFQRDHGSVVDMDSMIRLMRSNNYTKDPLSKCECDPPYSAENAISCRSDLNPPNGTYPFPALGHRDHGATDMKVTNSQLIESLSFTAIAGPTHDPTPVFDWSASTLAHSVPHNGQPVRWTFKPITHQWSTSLFKMENEDESEEEENEITTQSFIKM